MRAFLKCWLLLLPCVVLTFVLSYVSFYSYSLAPRVFHSVPAVRACDAAGYVVLFPAHLLLSSFGGIFDQSTPDSNPMNYIMTNAVLLGILFYACLRPVFFRGEKSRQ